METIFATATNRKPDKAIRALIAHHENERRRLKCSNFTLRNDANQDNVGRASQLNFTGPPARINHASSRLTLRLVVIPEAQATTNLGGRRRDVQASSRESAATTIVGDGSTKPFPSQSRSWLNRAREQPWFRRRKISQPHLG